MLICGLKLTHDGGVALLRDDELVLSVEIEKLANNPRFSSIADLSIVADVLAPFGVALDDVDAWAIDGWEGDAVAAVELLDGGKPVRALLAPYRERAADESLLAPGHAGELSIGGVRRRYTSYTHVTSHVAGAYSASPFAAAGEPALVLVWDGGTFPRLYHVDPARGIENGGALFPAVGGIYARAGHHFGPFRRPGAGDDHNLSVAGKLMAYIALGTARPEICGALATLFDERFDGSSAEAKAYRAQVGGFGVASEPSLAHIKAFYLELRERLEPLAVRDEDVLASVHGFLERLLLERLDERVVAWKGPGPWNLCVAGGCALNIKWNSAMRRQHLFADVWVPPFPNDSGSALGVAIAHLAATTHIRPVAWHPRLGPALLADGGVPDGWRREPCTPRELARVLHETGRPAVVLNGRAELGPRALGARSILAPPTRAATQQLLNDVKGRERYRPVAPICLVEHAPAIFDPGSPDPYMLFDHRVREDWADRIPAVVHLDGTARLQTVSPDDDPVLDEILRAYHRCSGIPVLCNTSANLKGRGFFPDVASALRWDGLDIVWSEGTLYRREAG